MDIPIPIPVGVMALNVLRMFLLSISILEILLSFLEFCVVIVGLFVFVCVFVRQRQYGHWSLLEQRLQELRIMT